MNKIQLHPISNPDPELRTSMVWDYTQEPTKEEWLRERGIPIPGSDEERDQRAYDRYHAQKTALQNIPGE